jgi:hypothetical protein
MAGKRKSKPAKDAAANATERHKKAMLAALAITGNVTRAADAAKVGRTTHYEWLEADPGYAKAVGAAMDEAADRLEDEARRRAAEGLVRYKFHQGSPVLHPVTGEPYYELEYSDTLLIFLLKGARPHKYRDGYEQTGDTAEEIARRAKELLAQMEAADGTREAA